MSAPFCCFVPALAVVFFHHRSEAAPEVDAHRVLLTYNREYDSCKDITDYSGHESKTAADENCELAFKALDQLRDNGCHGWRYPECRFVPGDQYEYRQCTCKIPNLDGNAVKSDSVKSFRECATNLMTQEQSTGTVPTPTVDFQQRRSQYDGAWQDAVSLRDFRYSDLVPLTPFIGAGASTSGYTYDQPGGSSAGFNLNEPGGSSNEYTFVEPDIPSAGYTFVEPGIPSAEYTYGEPDESIGGYVFGKTGSPTGEHTTDFEYLTEGYTEYAHASRRRSRSPAKDRWKSFACTKCPKKYSTEGGLREHMKRHTTNDTTCPVCGKIFSTKGYVRPHMETAHPEAPLPKKPHRGRAPKEKAATPTSLTCSECGKTYSNRSSLRDHQRSHMSLETYCVLCKKSLTSKQSYRNHMLRLHREIALVEAALERQRYEEEHPEKCDECDQRFKHPSGLKEHKKLHEGKTKCDVCGVIFPRRTTLNAHKRKEHPTTTLKSHKRKEHPTTTSKSHKKKEHSNTTPKSHKKERSPNLKG